MPRSEDRPLSLRLGTAAQLSVRGLVLALASTALACSGSDADPSDNTAASGGAAASAGGASGSGAQGSGAQSSGTGSGGSGSASQDTGGATSGGRDTSSGAAETVYLKASNSGAGDLFGVAVSLSASGDVLAVGANRESSPAQGVDGPQSDDSAADAGAAYVFVQAAGEWQQEAYLKASNSGPGDAFGSTVVLSADGQTLAVAAPFEASAAVGVGGDETDDSATDAGAVYVFVKSGGTWQQQAYLKAANTDTSDLFGSALALSADGSVLAVGAEGEDGAATGIDGDFSDTSAEEAGAVYVFSRAAGSWQQTAYVKASNTEAGDHFGGSVALSSDGTTLAVGAYWEDSSGSGAGSGAADDNSSQSSGAAYVFGLGSNGWEERAYLKPTQTGTEGFENFGSAVTLSGDGSLLAIGAPGDANAASGVDAAFGDHSLPYAGAAYVFSRSGGTWQHLAYLKPSYPGAGDEFGNKLGLSGAGDTLIVGAALEASRAAGPSGGQDDTAPESGAAYLFTHTSGAFQQAALLKAPNGAAGDRFGWAVALASGGDLVAVGASRESSAAVGVDGDATDDSAPRAGAAYLFANQRKDAVDVP